MSQQRGCGKTEVAPQPLLCAACYVACCKPLAPILFCCRYGAAQTVSAPTKSVQSMYSFIRSRLPYVCVRYKHKANETSCKKVVKSI